MDAISFVVRAVCQEFGIQSPIATHRIESRVLEALAARYGGEELRIYVAKMPLAERSRRHRAILVEHAAGDRAPELARRHGLTVRRINQILQRQRVGPADAATPWTIDHD